MATIVSILYFLLWLYTLVIIGRFVFDLILVFVPDWEPSTFIATLANIVMSLTDPPLKLLQRVLPPIRIGAISLDLGLVVLLLGTGLLQRLLLLLA